MSLGLIIQKTSAGLENQYISENLLQKEAELAATLTDERLLATQLANHSNVYSIQATKLYTVYSLIVTNVSDFVGRSGFFAVRLYVPRDMYVNDVKSQLHLISDRYSSFKENNNLYNQYYDDILNSNLINDYPKEYISIPRKEDAVIYINDLNEVDQVFYDSKCHLFNKVYVFQKENAVDIDIAIRQGMVPLKIIGAQAKDIRVSDPGSILKELRINEQNVPFNDSVKEYYILCWEGNHVTYNTRDDESFRIIDRIDFTIHKKTIHKSTQTTSRENRQRHSGTEVGLLLVVALMMLALSVGIWYFFLGGKDSGPVIQSTAVIKTDTIAKNNRHKILPIDFVLDTSNSVEKANVYKTNFSKLEKYRFKFENGQWAFKNIESENKYNPFFRNTAIEISKMDSLSSTEKVQFQQSLENISKQEIKEKPAPTKAYVEIQPEMKNKKRQDSIVKPQGPKNGKKEEQPKAQMKSKFG